MTKSQHGVSLFLDGFLCSQAVLATYGPEHGLNRDLALKLGTGFGGGMGRQGQICGAVTGGVMVIGLIKGAISAEDIASREKTYTYVKELFNRFYEQNGSTLCRELLNCDLGNPEEYQRAKEQKLFQTLCPEYVKNAIDILDDILNIKP